MALFEISDGELVPFRSLRGGADLYEQEIEDLLWPNLEEFMGEALLPIRRQSKLPSGGIPDILALDKSGRVVVFEIKRDVDRRQLAQCLEYAGWARTTNLDELASMYHAGEAQFWSDWQEFTESSTPVVINNQPQLVLVARDFQERTESAFDFLIENGVPATLLRISVFEDAEKRQFVVVNSDHEPELGVIKEAGGSPHWLIDGRRVRISDLLEKELIVPGETLSWNRPRVGTHHTAVVLESGAIELPDGRVVSSPSRAAVLAADKRTPSGDLQAYDGWEAWTVDRLDKTLDEVRRDLQKMPPGASNP